MNDYRQRVGLDRRFDPSTSSMGKFFSNRLRDSLHVGGALTTNERENFDQTLPDKEATPEPPVSVYDVNRSIVTPIPSTNESYFTQTTPDVQRFSRRVELSSGYNILKNRTSSRPARLPAQLQGRTPLAQLNPLPTTTAPTTEHPADVRLRRLSFTDHNRTQQLAYSQQMFQHYNADGTRRPFSSDSPIPPANVATTHHISSAPPAANRTAYDPVEPLKLAFEQEDNSIADLSRELRAAAYPTKCKSSNHSPTRETSPSTTRHTTRLSSKRAPPRSLPKLHPNDQHTAVSHPRVVHHFHHAHHEPEKHPIATDDRPHDVSSATITLDHFFSSEQPTNREPVAVANPHEPTSAAAREQPPAIVVTTPSLPHGSDDLGLSFVSKFARLAPIIPAHVSNGNTSLSSADENVNHAFHLDGNHHEPTLDTLHDSSIFHSVDATITDDLLATSDMTQGDDAVDESFSYVPLKEQRAAVNGIPLLELDELETNSDISESQLVPIIYAKELANEIELLQRAHSLKQQQRSMSANHENDRNEHNSSVPPPANMELLNFEALEEEVCVLPYRDDSPMSTARMSSPMMEMSTSPVPPKAPSPAPPSEIETPTTNVVQHGILAHNRLSPWFKLPTELWFKILPFLSTGDLHNFSYVCKRFYLLVQDQACQHRVVMSRQSNLEPAWFDIIARRKPISLTFTHCRQQNLEQSPSAVEYEASNIKWHEFFQAIGSNLLEFTMIGCLHEPFTPNTLLPSIVQTCSSLLSLSLRWNSITEPTLNQLTTYLQLTHLHTLDLTGCLALNDTLLVNIFIGTETPFQLTKLILQACANITWPSLHTIAICVPNLLHLDISRCVGLKNLSSNEDATCFHHWPMLEHLDLGHLRSITDADMAIILDHCPHLQTLIFDDCISITDQTLQRATPSFRTLSLTNCSNLTSVSLGTLNEQCPHLQSLCLNSLSNLTDACLLKWSESPLGELRSFSLDNCKQCSVNSIDKFLGKHVSLRECSLTGDVISNLIERKIFEEKFPHVKFVFQ